MKSFCSAILLTCHNRKDKTIACLNRLYSQKLPENLSCDVFLVDDGSNDGTSEIVKKNFPMVHLIKGNGKLYWNKGMRLAWNTASKEKIYDFYIWLNDDTLLQNSAITELLNCYDDALIRGNPSIIVGACQSSFLSNEFSYGGRTEKGPVIPNGTMQTCKFINGNIVLVPKIIYEKIGNLSPDYTHAIGDFDYGLRAINEGFQCYSTTKYIAVCPRNSNIKDWRNPQIPLFKRWKLLNSPTKGLCIKEYKIYRKKFWGWRWIIFVLKIYTTLLLPKLHYKTSTSI